MQIKSFQVQGFANLTATVRLEPLREVNVLHGRNDVGKSNLLGAIELYFRLLGVSEAVTRVQGHTFERPDEGIRVLLAGAFNRSDPQPVQWEVDFTLADGDLETAGVYAEVPCREINTVLELRSTNRTVEARIKKWQVGETDISTLDRTRDKSVVQFGEQLRRLLSDARPFKEEKPVLPVARFTGEGGLFPQSLRDALFDARQAREPGRRRRWTLFTEIAGGLRAELGDGEWDTAFDRSEVRAEILYVRGGDALALDDLGSGARRFAELAARLALWEEPWLCMEEPEWRLSPELQGRLVAAMRRAIAAGTGPRQVFLSTHSPALAAHGHPFSLRAEEGGPRLRQEPWELSPVVAAGDANGGGAPDAGLGDLIGLVENLADLDPSQLVAGESATAASPAGSEAVQPAVAKAPVPSFWGGRGR